MDTTKSVEKSGSFDVPKNVGVIGLIFYGRSEFVKILDRYLERNLNANGGLLDEVVFSVGTRCEADLQYLDDLLSKQPHYSKYVPPNMQEDTLLHLQDTASERKPIHEWWSSAWGEFDGFASQWGAVSEPDSVYIKMDDDIVFIEDCTISALTKRVLENPQYFAVSANVINGAAISWLHSRMGVYEPYLPEMEPQMAVSTEKSLTGSHISWRASELPSYIGPPEGPPGFCADGSTPAPYKGHRWLPIRLAPDETFEESNLPAETLTYEPRGSAVKN